MNNVFEFITNKIDYTLHFQNAEYTKMTLNAFICMKITWEKKWNFCLVFFINLI